MHGFNTPQADISPSTATQTTTGSFVKSPRPFPGYRDIGEICRQIISALPLPLILSEIAANSFSAISAIFKPNRDRALLVSRDSDSGCTDTLIRSYLFTRENEPPFVEMKDLFPFWQAISF
jgi:hypothetical protein